ncbi:acyltransferase [Enterococcus mundtii]|uniref:Acyltransferase n=1 Tax=Enterococcus mundtii TaxID=53346 RepID=A0A242L093_ENTMU|nr:acyltransferase [Enterococcus mundtii]OTP27614.1 hypothetical protein A5802_001349 [Enterococcus mundtii]OTP27617.1 hypothetical protein A5802_001352 [Enterococcus mundtii]
MKVIKYIHFILTLWIINKTLKGTHFFKLKRRLLKSIGIKAGVGTKIVGPIFIGRAVDLIIGDDCWIGKNFTIEGNGKVSIGSKCDLGPNVIILTGSHEIGNPARRAGRGITWQIKIGNGTWIGAYTIILNNIKIGNSTIIGASSLVNKSCENNCIYVGSPIKKIRELNDNIEIT